jgi:hypothetical protein
MVSAQAADQMNAKGVTTTELDRDAFRSMVPVVCKKFAERVPAVVPSSRRFRRRSDHRQSLLSS